MPKLEENLNPNQQTTNQATNPVNNQTPPQPNTLITTLGQLLPLAPFVFEQFTGQKVPHMSGTMAEIQTTLLQVVTNQQSQTQRLNQLETKLLEIQTSANQHLTNLTNQFNSLRLTHTKEQKKIEYGTNSNHSAQFAEENPDY